MVYPAARRAGLRCSTPSCRRSPATGSSMPVREHVLRRSPSSAGTRRNKPDAASGAWYLFALGQFMFAMGERTSTPTSVFRNVGFPSLGRRHLPVALPGAVRRHLHARPAAQPDRRVGVADRLADPDDRPRPDLVAGADLAGDPRQQPDGSCPSWSRSPTRRPTSCCWPARCCWRSTTASASPPSTCCSAASDAACYRLHLRRDANNGTYNGQVLAGHRLDRLLPAVGRLGAAPVDAHARGAGAGEGDEPVLARGWAC